MAAARQVEPVARLTGRRKDQAQCGQGGKSEKRGVARRMIFELASCGGEALRGTK